MAVYTTLEVRPGAVDATLLARIRVGGHEESEMIIHSDGYLEVTLDEIEKMFEPLLDGIKSGVDTFQREHITVHTIRVPLRGAKIEGLEVEITAPRFVTY